MINRTYILITCIIIIVFKERIKMCNDKNKFKSSNVKYIITVDACTVNTIMSYIDTFYIQKTRESVHARYGLVM
jgi:hypothetical protein